MRGLAMITATTLIAEVGDLRRFDSPCQAMAFVGLVPSEHSSGDKTRRGSITKTGTHGSPGHSSLVLRFRAVGRWTFGWSDRCCLIKPVSNRGLEEPRHV